MASPQPSMAVTQYDVVLEIPQRPDTRIPALLLELTEKRSGGWSGRAKVNPRMLSADDALQTLLRDGLTPGATVLVKLLVVGSTAFADVEARVWPSVVTAVHAAGSYDVDEPEAVCSVSFSDPVTYLADRPVWVAFVDCPIDEMLGGVLSNAAAGDGRPTTSPVLPGLPTIRIGKELGDEVAKVHYAIAAGEPLGRWVSRIVGRLGIRLSMVGDSEGVLKVTLSDVVPSRSGLNRDGGLDVTLDPGRSPGATNLGLSGVDVNSPSIVRGGLLDNVQGGSPRRFGPDGALESVVTEPQTSGDEAARRAGFRQANQRLAQTRALVTSCQPGFLPGRIVNLKPLVAWNDGVRSVDVDSSRREGIPGGGASLLGAGQWQLADVEHLCRQARYWNQSMIEKTGLAWRPELPHECGATVVSGVVDDGSSKAGELVKRDRMGRVPIRFPFVDASSGDETAEPPTPSPDIPWPPRVLLAPLAPSAGNQHGFVADHRQGDWCRVAVVNPLLAEIIGYSHREDRHLGEDVREASLGVVMRDGVDGWQGMLFRPDGASEDV